jgi:hypothetical protein
MIVIGDNSWVSLAEANTYMAQRFQGGAWATIDATEREQLLIFAYRLINSIHGYVFPDVPNNQMKYAQIEGSWFLYNFYEEFTQRQALYGMGVEDFTISKFKEKITRVPTLPPIVTGMLESFITLGEFFPVITRDDD